MNVEKSETRKQLLIAIGSLAIAFFTGIPWMDLHNTHDVYRAFMGRPVSCELQAEYAYPQAIALLSAGNERGNQTEPNYHEKRRIDAVVYEYLRLLENGTPPRAIILALDDGIEKNYKVRNRIQVIAAKHNSQTEIPNDLFITVHAQHTDTSLAAVSQVLESEDIDGPVAIITSDPHINRARYNTCRRGINGYVVSANEVLASTDIDTHRQMERLKNLPSYKLAWAIEKAKILSWMWRPTNIGSK